MTSLTRFENAGIELVIDNSGECFYPGFKALARVCSIGLESEIQATQVKRLIEKAIQGVTESTPFEAEILTTGGLQGVTLIPRKLGSKVIKKYNPDLYDEMADAGHLIFLHQLAGYKVKTELAKPQQESKNQFKDAIDLAASYLLEAGIDNKLIAGVKLNQAERYGLLPREIVAESHKVLAASFESPLLYTPTKLGQELGVSAVKINKLLTAAGYQVKNSVTSKTDPAYIPTEKGREFSANTLATGDRNNNSTYQHLKWKNCIVDILKVLMSE
jgi:hypothetical protein